MKKLAVWKIYGTGFKSLEKVFNLSESEKAYKYAMKRLKQQSIFSNSEFLVKPLSKAEANKILKGFDEDNKKVVSKIKW